MSEGKTSPDKPCRRRILRLAAQSLKSHGYLRIARRRLLTNGQPLQQLCAELSDLDNPAVMNRDGHYFPELRKLAFCALQDDVPPAAQAKVKALLDALEQEAIKIIRQMFTLATDTNPVSASAS